MKKVLILIAILISGSEARSQAEDLTFTVRKKQVGPITVNWFDFDSLQTGQPYQMPFNGRMYRVDEDSILCLNMDCKRYYNEIEHIQYLMFGSDSPGKAYIALYSYNRKNNSWRQNSMRPVVFIEK